MTINLCWTLAIAATSPFLPGSVRAQADADKAERRSTVEATATAQKNVGIIRRQIDAVNSGDAIAAAQFFAADTINHGSPVGRAGAQRVLSDVFATFPDWHVEIVDLVAVGDDVVIRQIVSGTHKGIGRMAVNGGLLMNVPPTGRRFKIQHIHWFTLRDGVIVAARANRDDVGMMQQLGLLPMPPGGRRDLPSNPNEPPAQVNASAGQRPPVKCTENSPERRGEEGCTILASRHLVGPIEKPLYWHIERFDSLAAAKKAAGPNGVAAEAHGVAWLMTVEPRTETHRGGHHVDWIGPLKLPAADRYTMRVTSSLLMPGGTSPVHVHSGPEVLYIVAGEQAMDTPEHGYRLTAGKSFILAPATIHRARVIGSVPRRALGLVVFDAAGAATHDLHDPPPLTVSE